MPTAGCVFSVYSSATVGTFFVFFFLFFFVSIAAAAVLLSCSFDCFCCCRLPPATTPTSYTAYCYYGTGWMTGYSGCNPFCHRRCCWIDSTLLHFLFSGSRVYAFCWSLSRSLRFFLCHCDTRNIHLAYTHTLHMYKWQNEEWVEKKGTKNTDTTYDILWV